MYIYLLLLTDGHINRDGDEGSCRVRPPCSRPECVQRALMHLRQRCERKWNPGPEHSGPSLRIPFSFLFFLLYSIRKRFVLRIKSGLLCAGTRYYELRNHRRELVKHKTELEGLGFRDVLGKLTGKNWASIPADEGTTTKEAESIDFLFSSQWLTNRFHFTDRRDQPPPSPKRGVISVQLCAPPPSFFINIFRSEGVSRAI